MKSNLIKINIGCGNDYKKGWINIDADKKVKADVYWDVTKNLPFKSNIASKVLVKDVLEHFTKEDGTRLLKEIYRILKIGGVLEIRVPNIFKIFKSFNKDHYVLMKFLYGETELSGKLGVHKYGYTSKTLKKVLFENGFKVDEIFDEETNYCLSAVKVKKQEIIPNIMISGIDSGGIGGAEKIIMNIHKYLLSRRIKSIILAVNETDFSKLLEGQKINTVILPFRMDIIGDWKGLIKFFLLLIPFLIITIKKIYYFKLIGGNVIILTGIQDKILISPIAYLFRIKVFWIEYSSLEEVFRKNIYLPKIAYRIVKSIPTLVFTPTYYTKSRLIRQTRISESKFRVVPLGIKLLNRNRINWLKNNSFKLRNEMGLKGKYIVGMVSRVQKEKGQDVLIRSIKYLRKMIPNVMVLLVGEGDTNYINNIIEDERVNDYVRILGFVPDEKIYDYYSLFDVFVFPTRWKLEGFGLVLAEALMMGIPVVAGNLPVIREVLENSALYCTNDVHDISEKIYKIYNDSRLRRSLLRNSINKVKKYDINKFSNKLLLEIQNNLL